jgi:hypothetical protein
VISIDVLPDDVLLAIFYFCVDEASDIAHSKESVEGWQPLVHVCRRWRTVVFGSPRHLNLRLGCNPRTPARDLLDIWPALPILIWGRNNYPTESVDNITALLERSDRVCQINLEGVTSSHLEVISAAMQVPFPAMTVLQLHSDDETVPVLPDSFLGGSAPHLRSFALQGIPFPGLPKLLLSATNLAYLCLFEIPHSGYFPPEAMVTALSTLTGLQLLFLRFQSSLSRPDRPSRRPPPSTRSVLPVLTHFFFSGVPEYLDDIVAGIDTPRLDHLSISLFNQIEFDTPQFVQFISRTPTFGAFKGARLFFKNDHARVELFSQTSGPRGLDLDILCGDVGWQMSSVGQVCTSCLPPLSTLEDLYIFELEYSCRHRPDNIENTLWLELLLPFASVMNLYLSGQVLPHIVPALQELIGAGTMQVLPTLQNIFLEELQPSGPVQEGIGKFVSTRQVTGHPIAVSHWEKRGRF